MCLIFLKPKGVKNYLTYERFQNALKRNPHSVGIMYKKDGKLKIKKYVRPSENKKQIYNLIKNKDEFAIHFRFATHGAIDKQNCHPFKVVDGLYLMHNGIMYEYGEMDKTKSDTRNFIELYLKPIIEEKGIEILKNKDFIDELGKYIGNGNKLLLIDKDFNHYIVNDTSGVWVDGCWASNEYSMEERKIKTFSSSISKDYYKSFLNKYKAPISKEPITTDGYIDYEDIEEYDDLYDYYDYHTYDDYSQKYKYYDKATLDFLNDKELTKILAEPFGYYDYDEEKYCY